MTSFVDGDRRELEKKAKAEGRLPPGQSLTLKWPVLHYGSVPGFDAAKWDFKISGQVEEPKRLRWDEFRALPQAEVTSDFHCVTRWSRLDNRWKSVKWVRGFMLLDHDRLGFWERNGYHAYGDPWKEQRYSGR